MSVIQKNNRVLVQKALIGWVEKEKKFFFPGPTLLINSRLDKFIS